MDEKQRLKKLCDADLRVSMEEHVLGEEEVGHNEAHEKQQGAEREQQEGRLKEEAGVEPVVRPLGLLLGALWVAMRRRLQLQQQVGARGGALRVTPCCWGGGGPPRLQAHNGASVRQRVPNL